MGKIKLSKKTLPTLSKDLNLEESVLKNLQALQESFQPKFEVNIKGAQKEALASYESKLKALNEAKAKILKEYDEEIGRYTALVKEIKGQQAKASVVTKAAKKTK